MVRKPAGEKSEGKFSVPKQRKQEGESRRAPKFKFKRDLKEIVADIHMSNK